MSEFTLEPLEDYPQRERVLALPPNTQMPSMPVSVPRSRICARLRRMVC